MRSLYYIPVLIINGLLLNFWTMPATLADVTVMGVSEASIQAQSVETNDNTFYVTMTLPSATSGTLFTRVSLTELGEPAPQPFELWQTKAFLGTPAAIVGETPLDSTWVDETGTVWVEFANALPSQTTLTVVLKTRTPVERSREFGIAAYPDTPRSVPVFVGNATLTVK